MKAYTPDGRIWLIERSKNLAYFDRYKGRENYRIVITKGKDIVYSEIGKEQINGNI